MAAVRSADHKPEEVGTDEPSRRAWARGGYAVAHDPLSLQLGRTACSRCCALFQMGVEPRVEGVSPPPLAAKVEEPKKGRKPGLDWAGLRERNPVPSADRLHISSLRRLA